MLKALLECSDREIFDKVRQPLRGRAGALVMTLRYRQIVGSTESNAFAAERVEVLLRETALLGVRTRAQCLAHLGKHFRAVRLGSACPPA